MKVPKQFPINAKTIAFCFFEGSALSIPAGILLSLSSMFITMNSPEATTRPAGPMSFRRLWRG
jgi:hypothetical protein